jgi:hypothetical protein
MRIGGFGTPQRARCAIAVDYKPRRLPAPARRRKETGARDRCPAAAGTAADYNRPMRNRSRFDFSPAMALVAARRARAVDA